MRQTHVAGDKLFVEWAGDTVPIIDPMTGEVHAAHLFVAALGASSYTYAEARWTETLPDWIGAHVNALDFLGGVPKAAVPDNLKVGITKPSRYEPGINRTYQDLEALNILQGGAHVDLVFTDMIMPGGLSGRDVAHKARDLKPGIKVLLTTGYAEDLAHADDLERESLKVLRKPYRQAELAMALREVLDMTLCDARRAQSGSASLTI
jgi:CheY-like chemotaxis protein